MNNVNKYSNIARNIAKNIVVKAPENIEEKIVDKISNIQYSVSVVAWRQCKRESPHAVSDAGAVAIGVAGEDHESVIMRHVAKWLWNRRV